MAQKAKTIAPAANSAFKCNKSLFQNEFIKPGRAHKLPSIRCLILSFVASSSWTCAIQLKQNLGSNTLATTYTGFPYGWLHLKLQSSAKRSDSPDRPTVAKMPLKWFFNDNSMSAPKRLKCCFFSIKDNNRLWSSSTVGKTKLIAGSELCWTAEAASANGARISTSSFNRFQSLGLNM